MKTIFHYPRTVVAVLLLFTAAAAKTITPEAAFNTHKDFFVAYDNNLYQISVSNWGSSTVTAEYLASQLLKTFTDTEANFVANYNNMLNKTLFKEFENNFTKSKLSRPGDLTAEQLLPELRTDKIVDLSYFNGQTCTDPKSNPIKQNRWMNEILQPALQKTEPGLSDPYALPEAAIFALAIPEKLYEQFKLLSENQSYTFAIKLGVFSGCELQTALLVTKSNDTSSFVWANPANNGLWDTNIHAALDLVMRLTDSPERVQNALIRYEYAYYSPQTKNVETCLKTLRDAIGATALKNNTLFKTIYYAAFKTIADKEVYKKNVEQERKAKVTALLTELKP